MNLLIDIIFVVIWNLPLDLLLFRVAIARVRGHSCPRPLANLVPKMPLEAPPRSENGDFSYTLAETCFRPLGQPRVESSACCRSWWRH